jgi:hypothetical protein
LTSYRPPRLWQCKSTTPWARKRTTHKSNETRDDYDSAHYCNTDYDWPRAFRQVRKRTPPSLRCSLEFRTKANPCGLNFSLGYLDVNFRITSFFFHC